MRSTRALLLLAALLGSPPAGAQEGDPAAAPPGRVWEIGGIRLERGQIDRLADDMAQRTIDAAEQKVEGLSLTDAQREQMHEVYRTVSLDVFEAMVPVVEREDWSDERKENEVRELVLAGQRRSHARLEDVLDERQMALYSAWEDRQVEAYRNRRSSGGRRRRR